MLPSVLLSLFATVALAVTPIDIQGSKFVNKNTGNRFNIRGVAYQPGGSSGYNPGSGVDPLSDGKACLRDAALMQQLGINAIRVYNIDPNINHDMCASIFNAVGIYLVVDVNSPLAGESLSRAEPWSSYHAGYLNRTFAVVEAFKSYPNTLLFFAGNEVINDVDTGAAVPPYLRAVTRDLKSYIAKNSQRKIPVGYSATDVRENLHDTWNYLQCTTTGDASDPSRVDIFALNSYSFCGNSSYKEAGYDVLMDGFKSTTVPVFFSEYGCNVPSPRIFAEIPIIYGPLMTPVLSGGIIYEYTQEPSNYGLVELEADGTAQLRSDYDSVQAQFNQLNGQTLEGVPADAPPIMPPSCVASLITSSKYNKNFTIPASPPGVQAVIDHGITDPSVGKIINVSILSVSQKVLRSNGDVITSLSIKPLASNESYVPSTADASPSSSSSSLAPTIIANSTNNTVVKNNGERLRSAALLWSPFFLVAFYAVF